MKNKQLIIKREFNVLLVLCFMMSYYSQIFGQELEQKIMPGYNINVIKPKEGQKFKPGEYVDIEVNIEGNLVSSPRTMVMLNSESEVTDTNPVNIKLKLDDKYTGESKVIVAVTSDSGFIGSKEIPIYVGDKSLAEGPQPSETRMNNESEWNYYALAVDLKSPEMCYKISPRATYIAGFSPTGHQVYYLRSECLSDVARITGNKSLCEEVKSISTPYLDGSLISKNNCIKSIEEGRNSNFAVGFDIEKFLLDLGYTEQNIPETYRKEGTIDYVGFYYAILNTEDFQRKLKALPDFSKE